MPQLKEGYTLFSDYECMRYNINFATRNKIVKSLQLTFGGWATTDSDDSKRNIKVYNWKIKRFFYDKSNDGYFAPRFITKNNTPNTFYSSGEGMIFNEYFFFLQEQYDKEFVIDYFKTLIEVKKYDGQIDIQIESI